MTKRLIAVLLVLCLSLTVLAACSANDVLDGDKAKQIALADMGITESEAEEIHVHITEHEGMAGYSIYITYQGHQTEYIIHGKTGEVLYKGEGSHSH
jgi:uncharacterized membrane protein YkoI